MTRYEQATAEASVKKTHMILIIKCFADIIEGGPCIVVLSRESKIVLFTLCHTRYLVFVISPT
jgi:hypothetical protein